MEWVLVSTADDPDVAESDVGYLRSRHVLGRVVDRDGGYGIEVRLGDRERAKALFAARKSLALGRLPMRRPARGRALVRSAGYLVVVGAVLVAAIPIGLILWGLGHTMLGSAGMIGAIVTVVALVVYIIMSVRLEDRTWELQERASSRD